MKLQTVERDDQFVEGWKAFSEHFQWELLRKFSEKLFEREFLKFASQFYREKILSPKANFESHNFSHENCLIFQETSIHSTIESVLKKCMKHTYYNLISEEISSIIFQFIYISLLVSHNFFLALKDKKPLLQFKFFQIISFA